MKRIVCAGLAAVLALVMAACVPERVVWSPDGSRAAILGADGLHMCDADGHIGPMLAAKMVAVQWMPDGKRFVSESQRELRTWKEVQAAFPDEVTRIVTADRQELVRKALLSFDGDWQHLFGELMKKTALEDRVLRWNVMALRDGDTAALKEKLGDHWEAVSNITVDADVVEVCHLADAGGAAVDHILCYLYQQGLHDLRLSPDGRAVAIAWTDDKMNKAILTVMQTDGSDRELEVGLAGMYPDWSPDGKYLVYIRPSLSTEKTESSEQFGTLSRRLVWDTDGKLFEEQKAPAPEDLAGLLFDPQMRVRVAKDGRIFFVSAEVTLPVTAADFDPRPELFCVDPGRQATVMRVVARSQLASAGDAPQYFEISPDGAHLSVPFQDGRVSVVDLATGSARLVQPTPLPGHDNNKLTLTSVPTWRSADELTFVRPVGQQAEVVRYTLSNDKAVVLSSEWPAATTEDWLTPAHATTTTAP
jgi:hypothetical protein